MRLLSQAIVAFAMIANQVISAVHIPVTDTAKAAEAQPVVPSNYTLTINTAQPEALELKANKGNFDQEVVGPLKAAQAAKAAADAAAAQEAANRAAALAAATRTVTASAAKPVVIGGDDAFAKLRFCEAGGDYTKNTGNGYYGAYQYDIRTWANYGGFARPDLAPPEVQDAKARATQAARGWSPWPACSRKLGLL